MAVSSYDNEILSILKTVVFSGAVHKIYMTHLHKMVRASSNIKMDTNNISLKNYNI